MIDPFSGNTSFEYDRVGRRTKRTLPNGIVTTWQYNWKDQMTNLTHKIGGTTLASVLYERATGGEPTKITREDGTYAVLGYDAALRLTNEVYYSSGGVPQTTNSYGYDASGSRIKLVKGGLTLTNSVSGGYQITAVKNAANGSTTNTYAYDAGGRVTSINRDGATLKLGYNTADQVAAATNGAIWVTYRHDASGRRTVSTNSAGTVRRLLVAPTPGTDLESPHLIANASGTVQQGYVYLGDDPILRYTTGGTASYYLEDGMGSVIGLAPASSPSTANTTRLCFSSCLRPGTPYPLLSQGFCVCELVAAGARNFRATSAIHGRGHGQSTGLMQPGTGRGRELSMSANNPCSRSVHANNHGREQSRFAHRQRPQSSVDRQWQRTRNVRRQSAVVNCPRPRMRHERNLSTSGDWQGIIHTMASPRPSCRPSGSRFTSNPFRPMPSFDPATVRQAVAEFTPRRPEKFQDLMPAKEVSSSAAKTARLADTASNSIKLNPLCFPLFMRSEYLPGNAAGAARTGRSVRRHQRL